MDMPNLLEALVTSISVPEEDALLGTYAIAEVMCTKEPRGEAGNNISNAADIDPDFAQDVTGEDGKGRDVDVLQPPSDGESPKDTKLPTFGADQRAFTACVQHTHRQEEIDAVNEAQSSSTVVENAETVTTQSTSDIAAMSTTGTSQRETPTTEVSREATATPAIYQQVTSTTSTETTAPTDASSQAETTPIQADTSTKITSTSMQLTSQPVGTPTEAITARKATTAETKPPSTTEMATTQPKLETTDASTTTAQKQLTLDPVIDVIHQSGLDQTALQGTNFNQVLPSDTDSITA
ncbi:hypothetical protein BaRGS_00012566 [Batillaria attramentaria]|uniref:Uncharacterized protein n=1 Tax=Batillaria attramentaria TaxID=370345 RepID=A0ABD0LA39_9CAEN